MSYQNSITTIDAKSDFTLQESTVKDYFALLKPGVMSLVVFTSLCGILLSGKEINILLAVITIICVSVASGGAAAINMWYDADIDSIMSRTLKRPIPKGVVTREEALSLGVILSLFSTLVMAVFINYLSAFILLFSILFYVFIYTMWLKRRTVQNIVIGGAAGSFPPMIGVASVTGTITLESVVLFLIIFMWTPPHFWALAIYRSDDYKKVNVPMLPSVKGILSTKIHILVYSIILFITTLLPVFIGMSGLIYLIGAILLNLKFLYHAISLFRDNNESGKSMQMFGYSIIYLFLIFTILVIDNYSYYPI